MHYDPDQDKCVLKLPYELLNIQPTFMKYENWKGY